MKLDNTRKKIEKKRSRIEAMKAELKKLEETEKGQENTDMLKQIRKSVSYDEFIVLWAETQKRKDELLARHKRENERNSSDEESEIHSDIT